MLGNRRLGLEAVIEKVSRIHSSAAIKFFGFFLFVFVISFLTVQPMNATAASVVKKVTIKNEGKNVTKKTLIMYVQSSTQIRVKVKPISAVKTIEYSSNNSIVANVDRSGKISAYKAGTAKIIVTVYGRNGKKKSAYVKIKVKNEAVTNVALNVSERTIEIGETFMLLPIVSPSDAVEQAVTWSSSKDSVATVSQKGIVTGISEGNAVITAKAGDKKAQCKVIVIGASANDIFAEGKGTEKSPYEIASLEQFIKISNYPDKYFKQIADIDFGYSAISPLFEKDKSFTGVYDGNNHSILNYSYNDSTAEQVSIFGEIGKEGMVKNLVVKDSSMITKSGAILVSNNDGRIQDCKVLDASVTVNVESYNHSEWFAGILCAVNNGMIQNAIAEGTLTGVADGHATLSVGGIAGKNTGNIVSCSSDGSLKITVKTIVNRDEAFSGGIAGVNSGIIRNSQADGSVYAYAYYKSNVYVGGVSGRNDGQVLSSVYLGGNSNIVGEGDYGNGDCNIGVLIGGGEGSIS